MSIRMSCFVFVQRSCPFFTEVFTAETGPSIHIDSVVFLSLTALPTITTGRRAMSKLQKPLLQNRLIRFIRLDRDYSCSNSQEQIRFRAAICANVKNQIAIAQFRKGGGKNPSACL